MARKRSTNTNGECDSVLPWEIPPSDVLLKMENAVRSVQLGLDQVNEAAMTNGSYSSHAHQSQWPIEAHVLTERAPIRPEILRHRMKDDYSELSCIYPCSFCPQRNLGSARKILPHRFNALWILLLHKCFLILAIIYFFKFQFCVLSSDGGQRWSCKMSSWEEIDLIWF